MKALDGLYPYGYTSLVYQLQQSEVFAKRLAALRDPRANARILARLESARLGNGGDIEPVGDGISEMRVNVGAGFRLYCVRRRGFVVVLLCGGDKSTQRKDIARAKALAREMNQE